MALLALGNLLGRFNLPAQLKRPLTSLAAPKMLQFSVPRQKSSYLLENSFIKYFSPHLRSEYWRINSLQRVYVSASLKSASLNKKCIRNIKPTFILSSGSNMQFNQYSKTASSDNIPSIYTGCSELIPESFQSTFYTFASALFGLALALAVVTYGSTPGTASTEKENAPVDNDLSLVKLDSSATISNTATTEEEVIEQLRSKFWPVLLEEWKMLLAAIALTFAVSLAELFTMKLGGQVIDSALNHNLDQFMATAWKLCGAVAVQGFFQFVSYTALTQATERVRARLAHMAFSSIIYQDKTFFDRHNSAELMNRLSSDVMEIRNVTKSAISLGVKSSTSIVGGMVAAFAKSPSLALLIAAAIGTAVSIGSLYARLLRRLSRASKDANARAIICANEATSSVTTVQAFVGEEREIARHEKHIQQSVSMSQRFGAALGFFKGISTAGVSGILVGVLLYGGHLVSLGQLSVGDLSSFVVVASSIQGSLGNIAQLVGQLSSGKDAVDRVFTIIDAKPKINTKTTVLHCPNRKDTLISGSQNETNFPNKVSTNSQETNSSSVTSTSPRASNYGSVKLENVTFAYANRPDVTVLHNVSIELEAGKTLSLVGQSGSGKSTISRLLLRFYDPMSGQVTVDGVDVRSLDPHWLRSQIGIVEQEPVLFAGTIWENIAYGKPGATQEEIEKAARNANCEDFIKRFPNGYDTIVGERGTQLSGGQKQRIAIARALLKNPRILILDEATSALDATTETLVQEALYNLMKNRTTLIIAHRLSTIKNSDTIVVLDHGRVVEIGNHESLTKRKGYYSRLVKQQMGQDHI